MSIIHCSFIAYHLLPIMSSSTAYHPLSMISTILSPTAYHPRHCYEPSTITIRHSLIDSLLNHHSSDTATPLPYDSLIAPFLQGFEASNHRAKHGRLRIPRGSYASSSRKGSFTLNEVLRATKCTGKRHQKPHSHPPPTKPLESPIALDNGTRSPFH